MTTMTIADLAARRVQLDEQIERLTEEKALINAKLNAAGAGTHAAGDWTLTVRANRRLDTARREQRFGVAQFPQYYEPKISTKAIREYLAPIELEQYMTTGSDIVTIK